MDVKEAHEVARTIEEYEKARDDTTYDGQAREWVGWLVYRLYEHGFEIKERS